MSGTNTTKSSKQLSYFEKQRDLLISDISLSMDSVLNNINTLNRSLESSIAVGKEFNSSADLWRNFYDGMQYMEELRGGQNKEGEVEASEETHAETEKEAAEEPQSQDQDVEMNTQPTDPISDNAQDEDLIATQKDTQEDSQQN